MKEGAATIRQDMCEALPVMVPAAQQYDPYADRSSQPFRLRQKWFRFIRPLIETCLKEKGRCRILDIGGTEQYWDIADDFIAAHNIEIYLLNLFPVPVRKSQFHAHVGDAVDLRAFQDNAFDLVHSNSVIEHVGSWANMWAMAQNVRRLAPFYYVQTPYFWFPFEPHFRFPLFHWMPEQLRCALLMRRTLGFRARQDSVDGAMRSIQGASLLDRKQFKALFPDASHRSEKFGGLTKSLIAIRTQG